MGATNLFLAYTPYHVFLSNMIALKRPECTNILVVISDFHALDLVGAINESNLFTRCIQLPGLYMQKSHFTAVKKKNIQTIHDILLNCEEIDNLFMGNDKRPESQATAYELQYKYPNITISTMEDGGNFYNSSMHAAHKNFLQIWLTKKKMGKWYEHIRILGQSSFSQSIYAIYPELIRPEISYKKIQAIESNTCFEENFQKFLCAYWKRYPNQFQKIVSINGIIVIAYSGFSEKYKGYASLIRKICIAASKENFKIAVKYHPREERHDYCNVSTLPNIMVIPEEIPTELIYASAPKDLKIVVGDISSALMTAKWILGERIAVYSVAKALNYKDRLLDVFQKIGIQLIDEENIHEIEF